MELEEYEEIIERSRARKEQLNKKVMEAKKRRTPALCEDNHSSDVSANVDVSKRRCVEWVDTNPDDDQVMDSGEESDCDDKENEFLLEHEELSYVPLSVTKSRGVAALQKAKTAVFDGDETESSLDEPIDESQVTTLPLSSTKNQRSRLAALADNIRQWEDQSPKRSCLTNTRHISHDAKSKPHSASSKTSKINTNFEPSVNEDSKKKVTFHPSCVSNNVNAAITRFSKNEDLTKQQGQKVHVWNEAVLATLESQGFVKSASEAKLLYNFKDAAVEQPATESIANTEHTTELKEKKHPEVIEKKVVPPSSVTPQGSMQVAYENQSTPVLHSTDPAELPLFARKALFERAFSGGTSKQTDSPIAPVLSVAQRAAMFEKAAATTSGIPKKAFNEPAKFTVPAVPSPKKTSSTGSSGSSGMSSTPSSAKFASPTKYFQTPEVVSPSKNASPHTRMVHQKLIDSAANDWKKKEIATKACDERKNEISALLNHWEKVSSSSSINAVETPENHMVKSSPECEDYSSVFEANDDSPDEEDNVSKDPRGYDPEYVSDQSSMEHGHSSQDDAVSYNSETVERASFSSSVAACNAIDEALEEEESSVLMPPPMPALDNISRYSKKSSSSGSSYSSNSSSDSSSSNSTSKVEKQCNAPVFDESEETMKSKAPLLYTVSLYRRQKQEKRAAPTKTIVRRPEVESPPSPEVDHGKQIEEKMKALQNEVLAQQTVISQTSQALNLCLATEEFFGSTEQVEGERLLLIATQKRIACLNEIQVLKNQNAKSNSNQDGTGTFILNGIKLPLKQDYINSQISGKGSDVVHYFLCIVRHGHQVIVTEMLSAEDGVKNGTLCFTNHITLHNLPSDFSIAFEVYSMQTKKEVLPHDRKYHIKRDHGKMRLTPKNKKGDSKLRSPAISSPGGPNAVRSSNFTVVGFTRFTLQNCDRKICTLEKVPFSSPLEGVLQLKMQLHADHRISEKGFLTMFEDVSGLGAWHRRWCVLNGKEMAFWKYPDEERKKGPMLIIDLKQCISKELKLISRNICARPHTFEMITVRPQEDGDKNTLVSRSVNTLTTTKYLLSADTKEERISWCHRLNESLLNIRKWHPQALRPIELSGQ